MNCVNCGAEITWDYLEGWNWMHMDEQEWNFWEECWIGMEAQPDGFLGIWGVEEQ